MNTPQATRMHAQELPVCPYTSETSVACRGYTPVSPCGGYAGAELCRHAVIDEITEVADRLLCHRARARAPMQILIVDDDPANRDLLRTRLHQLGAAVRSAPDGVRALSLLSGWRPDAIVTDWGAPSPDGAEFLAGLQDDPDLATVPVLMLSAKPGPAPVTEPDGPDGPDVELTGVASVPRWAPWPTVSRPAWIVKPVR